MATQHIYRVLLVCPAAQRGTLNTWLKTNGIDTGDMLSAPYSATGKEPITHYAACAALTAVQMKTLAKRLCTLASTSAPVGLDGMARDSARDAVRGKIAAFKTGGYIVLLDDNDRTWDNYQDKLSKAGLKPITQAIK